jgi:hypothetical protein
MKIAAIIVSQKDSKKFEITFLINYEVREIFISIKKDLNSICLKIIANF